MGWLLPAIRTKVHSLWFTILDGCVELTGYLYVNRKSILLPYIVVLRDIV